MESRERPGQKPIGEPEKTQWAQQRLDDTRYLAMQRLGPEGVKLVYESSDLFRLLPQAMQDRYHSFDKIDQLFEARLAHIAEYTSNEWVWRSYLIDLVNEMISKLSKKRGDDKSHDISAAVFKEVNRVTELEPFDVRRNKVRWVDGIQLSLHDLYRIDQRLRSAAQTNDITIEAKKPNCLEDRVITAVEAIDLEDIGEITNYLERVSSNPIDAIRSEDLLMYLNRYVNEVIYKVTVASDVSVRDRVRLEEFVRSAGGVVSSLQQQGKASESINDEQKREEAQTNIGQSALATFRFLKGIELVVKSDKGEQIKEQEIETHLQSYKEAITKHQGVSFQPKTAMQKLLTAVKNAIHVLTLGASFVIEAMVAKKDYGAERGIKDLVKKTKEVSEKRLFSKVKTAKTEPPEPSQSKTASTQQRRTP